MKRALLLIGSLGETGGGLKVGVWAAQALARDHQLTILTWERVPLSELDRLYGTALADSENISIVSAPGWLVCAFALARGHLTLLRAMILMRLARRMIARLNPQWVVSNVGETDLGQRLVQYVHYPWMFWPRPEVELRWYHWSPAVLFYRRLCMMIGGYSKQRAVCNLTLVNSVWTGCLFEVWYGIPARVLYPPVDADSVTTRSWEDRDNAVACIGRFSPEKRLLEAIDIVAQLRAAGFDLKLHLCGFPSDNNYLDLVRVAAARAGPWVEMHVGLPRERLLEIVGQCRYGLHAMIDEHFGIVVPEMLKLGCLPFVHRSGGPKEIVADNRLTWDDAREAVARIRACIEDPVLRTALSNHAAIRAEDFSAELFMDQLLGYCQEIE